MNEEKTGLVLSIIGTTKKFNRLESINNGRIIMFTDIAGVKLTSGWELSNNRFLFDLNTDEVELSFEIDGVTWSPRDGLANQNSEAVCEKCIHFPRWESHVIKYEFVDRIQLQFRSCFYMF